MQYTTQYLPTETMFYCKALWLLVNLDEVLVTHDVLHYTVLPSGNNVLLHIVVAPNKLKQSIDDIRCSTLCNTC